MSAQFRTSNLADYKRRAKDNEAYIVTMVMASLGGLVVGCFILWLGLVMMFIGSVMLGFTIITPPSAPNWQYYRQLARMSLLQFLACAWIPVLFNIALP